MSSWKTNLVEQLHLTQINFRPLTTNITKPLFYNIRLPWKYIHFINRARTDHNRLNSHLCRLDIKQIKLCECQREPETFFHILTTFLRYRMNRTNLFNRLYRTFLPTPISLMNLLHNTTKK